MAIPGPAFTLAGTVVQEVLRAMHDIQVERERRETQKLAIAGTIVVAVVSGAALGLSKFLEARKRQRAEQDSSRN
jgi:hypothetical protein